MTAAEEVLAEIKSRLQGLPGVSGVGISKGSPPKVVVYVDRMTEDIKKEIPPVIAGYGVQIEEVHALAPL